MHRLVKLIATLICFGVTFVVYIILRFVLPVEFQDMSDSQDRGLIVSAMFFALALLLLVLPEKIIIKWDRSELEWQRSGSSYDRSRFYEWERAYGDTVALKKWIKKYRWGGLACILMAFLTLVLFVIVYR